MEAILQDWEDFARSLGSVTSKMDADALRDHAELILKAVAADLETGQTSAQQEAKSKGHARPRASHLPETAATSHGSVRAEAGFTLAQMVSEYRALRASVLRLWGKEVAGQPDHTAAPDAYDQQIRFNEAIDEALTDSIKTYSYAVDRMAVTRARHRMAALGTLASGLGHDMANVLLSMRTCLRPFAETGLTPVTAPLVDGLTRAVNHLDELTKGLRALSIDPESKVGAAHATVLHEWWRARSRRSRGRCPRA